MSRMGLYTLNPAPKQRYNSYKGDMNGVCKNLLLKERKINTQEKLMKKEILKLLL